MSKEWIICERITFKGIGYRFQPRDKFGNVRVDYYDKVHFTYRNVEHSAKRYKGRYGNYFTFRGQRYYVVVNDKEMI